MGIYQNGGEDNSIAHKTGNIWGKHFDDSFLGYKILVGTCTGVHPHMNLEDNCIRGTMT